MRRITLLLAAAALVGACRDDQAVGPPSSGADPTAQLSPSDQACPRSATAIVRDEASLRAALAAARPGDVIAIDGLIPVSSDVFVTTEAVTVTCATRGSGLTVLPGAVVNDVLVAQANGVTADRLVLDGRDALGSAFSAYGPLGPDGLETPGPRDVRLTNNRVRCSGEFGACALLAGAAGALIRGNFFESSGSVTGLHIQQDLFGGSDGTRVEGNIIIATAPSTVPIFGGIRVRDGTGVTIAGNQILGPWQQSIAVSTLTHSLFERNRAIGAVQYGLSFAFSAFFVSTIPAEILGNTIRNNHVSDAGSGGILARNACFNTFLGNNLRDFAPGMGMLFWQNTGANRYVGRPSDVTDLGMRDCDGDGQNDPNDIAGSGEVRMRVAIRDESSTVQLSGNIRFR